MALAVSGGCTNPWAEPVASAEPAGPADANAAALPATPLPQLPRAGELTEDGNAPSDGSRYRMVVTLKLSTIEVPIGVASRSEEVWSYLDEEPIRAARSAGLGRNGFRVGIGRLETWPDLARVFRRMTGRATKQNLLAAIPGDPLPIVLKEKQPDRTIFTFFEDRTLSGRDYPPGDYLLSLVCTLDPDDYSRVFMTAMPQVRTTRRRRQFVMGKQGPSMVTTSGLFGLESLAFQLRLPTDSFLVIGPGARARNVATAGHHFLVHTKEGVEFETLLVLIPEVVAAPLR